MEPAPEAEASTDRVERAVREVVRTINDSASDRRVELREMAVRLLRDEVEMDRPAQPAPEATRSSNPFAMSIPLFLVGGLMVILFPPVGLLLFVAAIATMLWGVATVFLGR